MSTSLKQFVSSTTYERFSFNTYGLRLAAQEPKVRWMAKTKNEWELHLKNIFYRSIVECLTSEGKLK